MQLKGIIRSRDNDIQDLKMNAQNLQYIFQSIFLIIHEIGIIFNF